VKTVVGINSKEFIPKAKIPLEFSPSRSPRFSIEKRGDRKTERNKIFLSTFYPTDKTSDTGFSNKNRNPKTRFLNFFN